MRAAKPLAYSSAAGRRRSFWGWGYEDEQLSPEQLRDAAAGIVDHLGFGSPDVELPIALEDVELPPPRLEPPTPVAEICSSERYDRAAHAYGKAYRDVVRAFRGRFDHVPDVVAFPRDEEEVERLLGWCAEAGAAAIPVGGGTSVVGGVEAAIDDAYEGAVAIDLKRLDRVLDVDRVSRAARETPSTSSTRSSRFRSIATAPS